MGFVHIKLYALFLALVVHINCLCFDLNKMEISVIKRTPLTMVPSASGVEYVASNIYLIGDDSPWLFILDTKLKLVSKIKLFETQDNINEVIPKPLKPDFEAMTIVKSGRKSELFLFGSGSISPTRDVFIKTSIEHPEKCDTYSLTKFYAHLKHECKLSDAELNIEGAFANDKNIYLFNRGKNLIIWFNIEAFNNFIAGQTDQLDLAYRSYELPLVNTIQAGFSGATFVQKLNLILFTASIENTANWIDDGEVLGSYVGIINLTELEKSNKPKCIPITENGQHLPIKIESIAVRSVTKKMITLILVTDNDGGTSELIDANLLLN